MINAVLDYENRKTVLKINSTVKEAFAECCMFLESIYTRISKDDEEFAKDFMTGIINYMTALINGEYDGAVDSEISIDRRAFEILSMLAQQKDEEQDDDA